MYKEFGGEVEDEDFNDTFVVTSNQQKDDIESTLSLQQFASVLDKLTDLLSISTDGFLSAFKEKYGVPTTPEDVERLQSGLMTISEEYHI